MKTVILLSNKNHIPKIEGDRVAIGLNQNACMSLKKRNLKHKNINDYVKGIDIEQKAINWIKRWSNKKILSNKNFKELFDYGGLSIWWLMEDWVYYSYAYYDSIKDVIGIVEKIKNLIEKEKPDKIVLISDEPAVIKAARIICSKKNVRLVIKKNPLKILANEIKTKVRIRAIDFFMQSSWFLRKWWWKALKLAYRINTRQFSLGKHKILVFSTDPWASIKRKDGTTKRGNPYLYPIVHELNKNKANDTIVIDNTFNFPSYKKIITVLKEKMLDKEVNYDLLEGYIDNDVRGRIQEKLNYFKNKWNQIQNQGDFINSFVYEDFNLFELVKPQFAAYFSFRLKGHIMELEALKELIPAKRPDIVVNTDETRSFARALFYVCKMNKIKTIALQHGNLEGTIRCIHIKDEISKKIAANYCPIPEKTLVWGEEHKRFLIKNFYPGHKVVVTGSPRYDNLPNMQKIYNKKEILNKLNLDSRKKIVSLFTNSYFDEENIILLRTVFEVMRQFPSIQLIIKPHPSENHRIHHGLRRLMKSDALIINNTDAFELLYISDIVMIYWSTVGLEAMILDKPVIMINLSGLLDKVPYAKSGAAIGVHSAEGLISAIKNVLENREIQDKLRQKRRRFVYESAYKTDGLAAARIADLIENSIKK